MSCRFYKKFFWGKLSESDFDKHLKHCKECQHLIEEDKQVESLVRNTETDFQPETLWNTIESSLIREINKSRKNRRVYRMNLALVRAAAVLVIVILSGIAIQKYYFFPSDQLLSDMSLKQHIRKENAYMHTIENLEKNVQLSLNEGDIDLQLRYKEHLESMDVQIRDYQQALSNNPANSHIRDYLIKVLRDKKQVLNEFARLQRNS